MHSSHTALFASAPRHVFVPAYPCRSLCFPLAACPTSGWHGAAHPAEVRAPHPLDRVHALALVSDRVDNLKVGPAQMHRSTQSQNMARGREAIRTPQLIHHAPTPFLAMPCSFCSRARTQTRCLLDANAFSYDTRSRLSCTATQLQNRTDRHMCARACARSCVHFSALQ
eukprot:4261725-Pleurochrysis_carterae.AAC.1